MRHSDARKAAASRPTGSTDVLLPHLPPHLREVCEILARGLIRARVKPRYHIGSETPVHGESSLHFMPDESGHANPTKRRDA